MDLSYFRIATIQRVKQTTTVKKSYAVIGIIPLVVERRGRKHTVAVLATWHLFYYIIFLLDWIRRLCRHFLLENKASAKLYGPNHVISFLMKKVSCGQHPPDWPPHQRSGQGMIGYAVKRVLTTDY